MDILSASSTHKNSFVASEFKEVCSLFSVLPIYS